ncbi:MAG: hypothetical protein SFW08_03080 [Gemmatimonadaceae bacterium]|nr:hypothetical protein [Gemmatimonadaceae bacterium]
MGWRTAVVALTVALAACGGSRDEPAPRTPIATPPAPPPGTPSDCVLAERWEPCLVTKRLENAGLVPQLLDSAATLPMFNRPVWHYQLGRGELFVVLYADSTARRADLATVDSLTVSRRGAAAHPWSMPPLLVTSRNLAAVLLTESQHLAVRVEETFTAGLPLLAPK